MDAQQQKQQTSSATAQSTLKSATAGTDSDCRTCSACNHSNELEASYCEECGQALQKAECLHCGFITEQGGDICERCGTWQLAGQCMFCYAPLADDDLFCSECGNPAEGVVCPECGNRGCFDYCATCSIPLTETAKQMLQEAAGDPKIKELVLLLENISIQAPPSANPSQKQEMAALESYLVRVRKQRSPEMTRPETVSLFSHEQKESINMLHDEIVRDAERKRQEAEEQRRLDEEENEKQRVEMGHQMALVNNLLATLSDRKFQTSQDARRFFGTIKAALPKGAVKNLNNLEMVWKCNAYNTVHPDDTRCASPQEGGVWFFVPGPLDWVHCTT
ncbi:MAG: zinc ribbon domain-containing protein [Desulfuromonadales bacterium]